MQHKQHGSTLLVSLIMLMLLTLIAISSMNSTTSSIQVIGNAQFREEANAAAQQGIESIISSDFTVSPAASTVPVTFGAVSLNAQVEVPTCISSIGLTNADLDPNIAADAACLGSSSASNTGILSASGVSVGSEQSWCFDQKWDVRATINDTNTGANVAVHQGVSKRVAAGTECS